MASVNASLTLIHDHTVHLEAPDTVLVERYAGKRVDSVTKGGYALRFLLLHYYYRNPHPDVYHLVFAPPRSNEVTSRLIEEPGGIELNVHSPLESYHRENASLLSCYTNVSRTFNADQPIEDLFDQGIGLPTHLISISLGKP